MKAIVYHRYGSTNVLNYEEIEKPTPADNEILIKIHAASVNPSDLHSLKGTPFLFRLEIGIFKPKYKILGADIAGTIEAVGKEVRQFQIGDQVFGDIGKGGFAEYVCVTEDNIALKPSNISFESAAAVPLAAVAALQGLRDKGKLHAGQKVLINGASGGVGSFAVQIAKAFGAEVTGVCSTKKMESVRLMGAKYVIDYTQEDFTKNGKAYDLILDMAAYHSVSHYKNSLTERGTYVMIGGAISRLFQMMIFGPFLSRNGNKRMVFLFAEPNKTDLEFVRELLKLGQVTAVIDKCYPLLELAKALTYLEEEHHTGKIIITT